MTSTRAAKRILTGLAACLLLLTACSEAQTAAEPTRIADLEPRDEAAVRASLAALDPCDLLAAADVVATSSSPHVCVNSGEHRIQIRPGVRLDAFADEKLTVLNDTYVVESRTEFCRVVIPSSQETGVEVVAPDCMEARSISSAVIDRLNSGDAAISLPPAGHDACALLARLVPVVESRLDALSLDSCRAPTEDAESGLPAGLNAGTTLTLSLYAQEPPDLLDTYRGSALVRVAGQPVVIADADEGGCRALIRLETPDASTGPFGALTLWAEVYSSTEQCDSLRRSAGELVRAAAKPPTTPNPEYLSYPATDVQN